MGCEVVYVREPRVTSRAAMDVSLDVLRMVCGELRVGGEASFAPETTVHLVRMVEPFMTRVRELRVETLPTFSAAVRLRNHFATEQFALLHGGHSCTTSSAQEM